MNNGKQYRLRIPEPAMALLECGVSLKGPFGWISPSILNINGELVYGERCSLPSSWLEEIKTPKEERIITPDELYRLKPKTLIEVRDNGLKIVKRYFQAYQGGEIWATDTPCSRLADAWDEAYWPEGVNKNNWLED